MLQTFTSLLKNKETRNRILFTLAMLLIYRIGSAIPVPGVDSTALSNQISENGILGIMNMLGGGDFGRLLLLDRISPLLTLIVPAFYGVGYLRGPRLRAMVHGNIRLARRRHNRKERKAREQRMRKEPQKKKLI